MSVRFAHLPTEVQAIDDAVTTLRANQEKWGSLAPAARIAYLEDIRDRIPPLALDWVSTAVDAKGIGHAPSLSGEEWLSGPWVILRGVLQLIETVDGIAKGSSAVSNLPTRTSTSGQAVVEVFPRTLFDKLLMNGIRAEVWMQPGETRDTVARHTAIAYRRSSPKPSVSLVLGAGNIASIAPLDVLSKLFTDLSVVILKLSPVNDYLGPFIEDIFSRLVEDGFLRIVYGGPDVGEYLSNHPGVDTIHITGSLATHNAIVFGPQKTDINPRPVINNKPITSELGGVSPIIVVPGPWSAADIEFQAKNIATQRLHNGGFNCVASQALVLPDTWEHTGELQIAVKQAMSAAPDRTAYYPGADQRSQSFVREYGRQCEIVPKPGTNNPLLIHLDAQASSSDQLLYHQEAFAPVLGMPRLAYRDEQDFLHRAVDFCNLRLQGTLGANIIIHPDTRAKLGSRFEAEVARLKYGCIAVNLWTGVAFLLTETTWGGFPGHSIEDVQSGRGIVHNTMMFDHPEKTVLYGPFRPFPRSIASGEMTLLPTPPWFVSHQSANQVGRRLFDFLVQPSWFKLPSIFLYALRS